MSDETTLLPCPFCGGEAKVTCAGRGGYQTQVGCTQCNCRLHEWFRSKAKAVKAWNTRAERTCRIEGSYLNDFTNSYKCWYEFEMECGYEFTWDEKEPPNYCPNCGRKVSA